MTKKQSFEKILLLKEKLKNLAEKNNHTVTENISLQESISAEDSEPIILMRIDVGGGDFLLSHSYILKEGNKWSIETLYEGLIESYIFEYKKIKNDQN